MLPLIPFRPHSELLKPHLLPSAGRVFNWSKFAGSITRSRKGWFFNKFNCLFNRPKVPRVGTALEVTGSPHTLTPTLLRSHLERFGKVVSIQPLSSPGTALVVFDVPHGAYAALQVPRLTINASPVSVKTYCLDSYKPT